MLPFDAVIVGGGPAGLSAALVLGRCRRRVLVCDDGHPRNAASRGLHGFLTRDGIAPAELLTIARGQLGAYPTVQIRHAHVDDARRAGDRFEVTIEGDAPIVCRKLLLATGVRDNLPELAGLSEFYGTSIFHCPYCDGWEVRDQPLVVYGPPDKACGLALELTAWSANLVVCTDGRPAEPGIVDRLERYGIAIRDQRVAALEGTRGQLERITFEDGAPQYCRAMFLATGCSQRSDLAARLGCVFNEKGAVATGEYETTNIPGLYVAGDASRLVHLAVVAAAEGAQAAFAMNTALLKEDLAAGYDVTAPA